MKIIKFMIKYFLKNHIALLALIISAISLCYSMIPSPDIDELKQKGIDYFNYGKYSMANKSFNKALTMDPSSDILWEYRGITQFNLALGYDRIKNKTGIPNLCNQSQPNPPYSYAKGFIDNAEKINGISILNLINSCASFKKAADLNPSNIEAKLFQGIVSFYLYKDDRGIFLELNKYIHMITNDSMPHYYENSIEEISLYGIKIVTGGN